jgi:hypothetical protein
MRIICVEIGDDDMRKLLVPFVFIMFMVVSSGCARKIPINNNNGDNKTVAESNTDSGTKPGKDVIDSKNNVNETSDKQSSSTYRIKDYYPFKENIKYEYEGNGMEYSSFTTWVGSSRLYSAREKRLIIEKTLLLSCLIRMKFC